MVFQLFRRNRLYTIINLGGLVIGLACCLLIFLYVLYETSYDAFLVGGERVYRVTNTLHAPGRPPAETAYTMGPLKEALVQDFPGIEAGTRLYYQEATVKIGDRIFSDQLTEVDPAFFSVLDLPLAEGSGAAIFTDNTALIISESLARKYFGNEPAMGKILTINDERTYQVAGILKDIPQNSHLQIDLLAYFDTGRYLDNPRLTQSWLSPTLFTYVRLRAGTGIGEIISGFPEFVDRYIDLSVIPAFAGNKASDIISLNLMPVGDIHLRSVAEGDLKPGGSIKTVYTFSAIALFVLLIAGVNYTNLSVALSAKRAREVGIRKVVGAARAQLIRQFLGESMIAVLIAFILCLALSSMALPWYNRFLGLDLDLAIFLTPRPFLLGIFFLALIGIGAGLYPAFYLSSFRPAETLGASKAGLQSRSWLRTILVLVQFSISIALIASTWIAWQQVSFAEESDLGFEKENMIIIDASSMQETPSLSRTLVQELAALKGIRSVSQSSHVPSDANQAFTTVDFSRNGENISQFINYISIDDGYFSTYGIDILTGRDFSENFGSDPLLLGSDVQADRRPVAIILNAKAVSQLGFSNPDEAVGQLLRVTGSGYDSPANIVGVVKDFHLESVREEITPMVYLNRPDIYSSISVRLNSGDMAGPMDEIDALWARLQPDIAIARDTMESRISGQYLSEGRRVQIFSFFSIFALFVAGLGLFGLASYDSDRRAKEIGVRKIMGASSLRIVRLMVFQFSKPVLLANLISWPIAWYFMRGWLNTYAYRVELTLLPFLLAGGITLLIAWITVAGHAFNAARKKPVHALRYE